MCNLIYSFEHAPWNADILSFWNMSAALWKLLQNGFVESEGVKNIHLKGNLDMVFLKDQVVSMVWIVLLNVLLSITVRNHILFALSTFTALL